MTPAELTTVRAAEGGRPAQFERGCPIPAPRDPASNVRGAFSPDDASPSRARLGRVAAMIADAERATPPGSRMGGQDAGDVLAPLPRRPRPPAPRRRDGAGALRTLSSALPATAG